MNTKRLNFDESRAELKTITVVLYFRLLNVLYLKLMHVD